VVDSGGPPLACELIRTTYAFNAMDKKAMLIAACCQHAGMTPDMLGCFKVRAVLLSRSPHRARSGEHGHVAQFRSQLPPCRRTPRDVLTGCSLSVRVVGRIRLGGWIG
jgi:hypothetical protein